MSLGCAGRVAIFALVLAVGALLAGVIAGAVAGPCPAGSLGCYSGVGPFLLVMVVVVVVALIAAALPWEDWF